jgi:hypothetical protein
MMAAADHPDATEQAPASALSRLLWMRATNRSTAMDRIQVLLDADAPPPDSINTDTKQLEFKLAIAPARVYLYLGRTLDAFGSFGFAVEFPSTGGDVSPFDTGGLVNKIHPVCTWTSDQKQAYLTSATWPASAFMVAGGSYPGHGQADVSRYLDVAQKPTLAGPHDVWPTRIGAAPIWRDNTDWRCWTWEARFFEAIETGLNIVAWTCAPAIHQEMQDALCQVAEAASCDVATIDHIAQSYIEGGIGFMVRELRKRQEPT